MGDIILIVVGLTIIVAFALFVFLEDRKLARDKFVEEQNRFWAIHSEFVDRASERDAEVRLLLRGFFTPPKQKVDWKEEGF